MSRSVMYRKKIQEFPRLIIESTKRLRMEMGGGGGGEDDLFHGQQSSESWSSCLPRSFPLWVLSFCPAPTLPWLRRKRSGCIRILWEWIRKRRRWTWFGV